MKRPLFDIINPTSSIVPILISIPHSGVEIPIKIRQQFKHSVLETLDDTDFFVDHLYDFAIELGITIIKANVSRYVIDLNRAKTSENLYTDGRHTTSVMPTTDFFKQSIYKDGSIHPDENELKRRLDLYYIPYYNKVEEQLDELKNQFGKALLWDAHSIRRHVPTIRERPFTDFILGDNDGKAAASVFSKCVFESLNNSAYSTTLNQPFQGGNITRHFGKPDQDIHALQLEMSKDCYMDDMQQSYKEERATKIKAILRKTLEELILKLTS